MTTRSSITWISCICSPTNKHIWIDVGTDRGSSCGLLVVFLLQNVWNSGNIGTSDLQQTQIQAHNEGFVIVIDVSVRILVSIFLPSMALCRIMWSKNFVLLAYIPPQPGHATTFSWVWLRRCSRSLGRPLAVASQSGE